VKYFKALRICEYMYSFLWLAEKLWGV